eukprot:GHVS01041701.1.p1 GENE.GHVS01041701.1~~GHVS01041701.1.p1  ORF type:complete len:936 (+),score=174.63 GHVS01041701.1:32-2839(+)
MGEDGNDEWGENTGAGGWAVVVNGRERKTRNKIERASDEYNQSNWWESGEDVERGDKLAMEKNMVKEGNSTWEEEQDEWEHMLGASGVSATADHTKQDEEFVLKEGRRYMDELAEWRQLVIGRNVEEINRVEGSRGEATARGCEGIAGGIAESMSVGGDDYREDMFLDDEVVIYAWFENRKIMKNYKNNNNITSNMSVPNHSDLTVRWWAFDENGHLWSCSSPNFPPPYYTDMRDLLRHTQHTHDNIASPDTTSTRGSVFFDGVSQVRLNAPLRTARETAEEREESEGQGGTWKRRDEIPLSCEQTAAAAHCSQLAGGCHEALGSFGVGEVSLVRVGASEGFMGSPVSYLLPRHLRCALVAGGKEEVGVGGEAVEEKSEGKDVVSGRWDDCPANFHVRFLDGRQTLYYLIELVDVEPPKTLHNPQGESPSSDFSVCLCRSVYHLRQAHKHGPAIAFNALTKAYFGQPLQNALLQMKAVFGNGSMGGIKWEDVCGGIDNACRIKSDCVWFCARGRTFDGSQQCRRSLNSSSIQFGDVTNIYCFSILEKRIINHVMTLVSMASVTRLLLLNKAEDAQQEADVLLAKLRDYRQFVSECDGEMMSGGRWWYFLCEAKVRFLKALALFQMNSFTDCMQLCQSSRRSLKSLWHHAVVANAERNYAQTSPSILLSLPPGHIENIGAAGVGGGRNSRVEDVVGWVEEEGLNVSTTVDTKTWAVWEVCRMEACLVTTEEKARKKTNKGRGIQIFSFKAAIGTKKENKTITTPKPPHPPLPPVSPIPPVTDFLCAGENNIDLHHSNNVAGPKLMSKSATVPSDDRGQDIGCGEFLGVTMQDGGCVLWGFRRGSRSFQEKEEREIWPDGVKTHFSDAVEGVDSGGERVEVVQECLSPRRLDDLSESELWLKLENKENVKRLREEAEKARERKKLVTKHKSGTTDET